MDVVRKILIFVVLTAGIIMLGRLAGRILPRKTQVAIPAYQSVSQDSLLDSTNALPEVAEDTTGGKWQQKLFTPLLRSYGLPEKHIKPKQGFFEIVLPKGKPIHEYALEIETLCHRNEIVVEQGVELHPTGRSIEYLLQSNGQHIKLRATLGQISMAGSAKVAIVFIEIDSLQETELAVLEGANWSKSLVLNPYSPNPVLKKLRFTSTRNELLLELPMEPAAYPYVDPGKHALFIHHSQEEVSQILEEGFDSLPKALGFATKYGDRAIENLPLLDKVFQYAAPKHLVFLDLTGSPRSLARQSAAAQGARGRSLQPYRDSLHVDEELVRKAVQAEKTGEAILVLPYTRAGFRSLEAALTANAAHFDELGVELVTFSALLSATGDSILPSMPAPVAKPVAPTVPVPSTTTSKVASKPTAPSKPDAKAKPKTVLPAHPRIKPASKTPAKSKPSATKSKTVKSSKATQKSQ